MLVIHARIGAKPIWPGGDGKMGRKQDSMSVHSGASDTRRADDAAWWL